MSKLVLPTIKEVDQREMAYRKYVIDKNIYDIVLSMHKNTKYKGGAYKGAINLYNTSNTIASYENVRDCILEGLKALKNSNYWHFRVDNVGKLHWSSVPFPSDKPWWRFW